MLSFMGMRDLGLKVNSYEKGGAEPVPSLGTGGAISFARKLCESVGLGRDTKAGGNSLSVFRAEFKHVGVLVNGRLQFRKVRV